MKFKIELVLGASSHSKKEKVMEDIGSTIWKVNGNLDLMIKNMMKKEVLDIGLKILMEPILSLSMKE